MAQSALIFGSIGVLAETSDTQRRAFNTAFEEHELYWHWDEDAYRTLLEVPGGKARIRYYAMAQGTEVDIEAIYESKIAAFGEALSYGVTLRPGVVDLFEAAKADGIKIGFATTTDPRQVNILLNALRGEISASDFDYIGSILRVAAGKPASDIYFDALRALDVKTQHAVAIEDTPSSCESALGAGLRTYAYPGAVVMGRQFPVGATVTHRLETRYLPRISTAAA